MKPSAIAVIGLAFGIALAGCSAAAVPPTNPATPPPDAPTTSGPANPPGAVIPVGPGQPKLVLPKPGQLHVHDVGIEQLSFKAAARHVVVNARWWSGVEPCSVLDSVGFSKSGTTITVAVREGSGAGDVACIDIAMLKVTAIDLGDLEPGDYTIVASQGSAPVIAVTVS